MVGDLDVEMRAAIPTGRKSDEPVAVDDGLRHRSPGDDDVRHVLGHLSIPRQQFSRWRHDFPVRAAVLIVGHPTERLHDARKILEATAELATLAHRPPELERTCEPNP